jgi:hypothetical protein
MASAGTLLSDLDSKTPVFNKDDDLVNKILADMNVSSNPITPSGNGRVINSPNPNSTYPMATDPSTATAHLIGKDYPTPSDFANVMYSPQFSGGSFAPVQQQQQQPTLIEVSKGNMYSDIISQIKQPLLVAIIVFVVSLPIINVLIGHYVPSLLRLGGDLTTVGLFIKSFIGGFLFWFIQKVLVPLMV